MDLQLTGNRLIEPWMDLLPDLLITGPEAILFVQQRRQEHEADQAERAQAAAALPGQEPHVNVPWTDENALRASDNSMRTDGNSRDRHFPWVITC